VSHPDSWAHIQVPHLCSVCVCVRIHPHTPTYTPTQTTGAFGRRTENAVPIPPTWTDLRTKNSQCLIVIRESAAWKSQSCDFHRLWRHSQSSKKIGTPTRWLLWQMIKAEHSTSSCSNCFVSRVHVTKTKRLALVDPHVKWLLLFFPLSRGEGDRVWKRETLRDNRDTRKEDRYPVLGYLTYWER